MKAGSFNCRAKKLYFLLLAILLCNNLVIAQNKNSISKTKHNSYKITPNDQLSIINRFGQVKINTWEKSEIEIDVTIKAWAKNETEAREILDRINIDDRKKEDGIYYVTKIEKKFKKSKNAGFEINYEVNMPQYTALNLENRFGPTYLADHSGKLSLLSAYGSLNAKKISGKNVNIQINYGQASIDEIKNGNVKTSYCNFVEIGKVGDLTVDDRNGKLEIESADNLVVKSAYSHFSLNQLEKSLMLESKFGSAEIDEVSNNMEKISVDIAYGSLEIDTREVDHFNFDISVSFGSFDSGFSDVVYSSKSEGYTNKRYEGKKGNGGNRSIKVNSSYGSVRF